MKVKDIMCVGSEFVASDAPIRSAAELMSSHQIGFLPVREGGQIVGVVTDRDLAIRPAKNSLRYDSCVVADVMTPRAHAVQGDTPLAGAVGAMKSKAVQRLLVLDERKQLVGVISASDIAARGEPQLACSIYRYLASMRSAKAAAHHG